MNIYVLNSTFQPIGIIDVYKSVIWTTRYSGTGEFELYCNASTENLSLLKKNRCMVRDKDINGDLMENVMMIKNIELRADPENGDMLIITGRDLRCIIGQRVIGSQTYVLGSIPECIHMILMECVIYPENSFRHIPNFEFKRNTDITTSLEKQVVGENAEDFITNICEEYELGCKVYIKAQKLVFELYEGKDRSYNQSENPFVVFSVKFDNLITADYQNIGEDFKNVAYVGGEGEGNEQKIVVVGNGYGAIGLNRFETWVDAESTSSNEGMTTETVYENILEAQGSEALAATANNELYECETDAAGQFQLNRDYFLGDIVQFENGYGVNTTARVLEVIESEDSSGIYCIPTFSTLERN